MRLTDTELRDVLARAEEIERTSRLSADMNAEMKAVISAAEEVGLSRTAVERALRERFDLPAAPPQPGELTFAKSADGKYYVAEVVSGSDDAVRVRFMRGSEYTVRPEDLRPCAFVPGERVMCNWPWWGPWNCSVVAYDRVKQRVKLTDGWGYNKTFPISEVWLNPVTPGGAASARTKVYTTLLSVGAAVGAGIVGLVTAAFLLR